MYIQHMLSHSRSTLVQSGNVLSNYDWFSQLVKRCYVSDCILLALLVKNHHILKNVIFKQHIFLRLIKKKIPCCTKMPKYILTSWFYRFLQNDHRQVVRSNVWQQQNLPVTSEVLSDPPAAQPQQSFLSFVGLHGGRATAVKRVALMRSGQVG